MNDRLTVWFAACLGGIAGMAFAGGVMLIAFVVLTRATGITSEVTGLRMLPGMLAGLAVGAWLGIILARRKRL